jgi:hypothetical protein
VSRKPSDHEIVLEISRRYSSGRNIRDQYFICVSEYIEETITLIENSNAPYMDLNTSDIYSIVEEYLEANISKLALKEVLVDVMRKYPNFERAGNGYRIYNLRISDEKNKMDEDDPGKYHIRSNTPFYLNEDDFFDKNSKLLKKFLDKAEKVAIAPEMILLPFFYKIPIIF